MKFTLSDIVQISNKLPKYQVCLVERNGLFYKITTPDGTVHDFRSFSKLVRIRRPRFSGLLSRAKELDEKTKIASDVLWMSRRGFNLRVKGIPKVFGRDGIHLCQGDVVVATRATPESAYKMLKQWQDGKLDIVDVFNTVEEAEYSKELRELMSISANIKKAA